VLAGLNQHLENQHDDRKPPDRKNQGTHRRDRTWRKEKGDGPMR
jgi:hypothetical protein